MKKNNKGFSLVELIVVIAIMAVLVGVLAPTLLRYVEKARTQKDASAVSEVVEAIVIACANEDIYKGIDDDGDSIVTMDPEGNLTATNFSADAKTKLETELKSTIGTYEFASSNCCTINFKVTKDTNGIVSVNVVSAKTDDETGGKDWVDAVTAIYSGTKSSSTNS